MIQNKEFFSIAFVSQWEWKLVKLVTSNVIINDHLSISPRAVNSPKQPFIRKINGNGHNNVKRYFPNKNLNIFSSFFKRNYWIEKPKSFGEKHVTNSLTSASFALFLSSNSEQSSSRWFFSKHNQHHNPQAFPLKSPEFIFEPTWDEWTNVNKLFKEKEEVFQNWMTNILFFCPNLKLRQATSPLAINKPFHLASFSQL